jgi:chaperonin GroEL (HSP60 family)
VIVHGLDDDYCNPADKMLIAANMVRAGFRPDTHFLTPNDIDGIAVTNTGHGIGNRAEVISKYAHNYLAENGKFAARLPGKSDLDSGHEVVYPVTGGKYIVSFKNMPEIRFEK